MKDNSLSDKQLILFQYDYYNSAWGLQHNGFLIDNKGNVLTYDNPEGWNHQDKLTEEQLIENIQKCRISSSKVPAEDLHKYKNYIHNISSSKITAKRNVSYDAGTSRFICYQYSESTGTYVGYLIKMEGDYTSENLNFYSKKVTLWMRDIGIATGNNVISDFHR